MPEKCSRVCRYEDLVSTLATFRLPVSWEPEWRREKQRLKQNKLNWWIQFNVTGRNAGETGKTQSKATHMAAESLGTACKWSEVWNDQSEFSLKSHQRSPTRAPSGWNWTKVPMINKTPHKLFKTLLVLIWSAVSGPADPNNDFIKLNDDKHSSRRFIAPSGDSKRRRRSHNV